MSTHTSSEPKTPPFKFGDVVEHGAGVRIVVKQCSLQVQHERTRWIIDGEDGNRYFAKNCRMIVPSDTPDLISAATPAEYVPIAPWKPTDPMERHPAVVARNAICSTLGNYSPEAREFVLSKCTDVFSAGLKSSMEKHYADLQRENDDLSKQIVDRVKEIEERDAELVRSAQTAATLANRIQALTTALGYSNGERNQAQSELDKANQRAGGWREVVAKCELLMQMNGSTPTDPATSAVPLQLEHRLKCLASLEKRIESAHLVLDGKSAEVAS